MLREICCDINVLSDTSDFESEDEVFFLVPAMFDIQVNGYNKISLDDELTVDALEKMTEDMYRDGVSQFVPTIITCDYQKMVTALINTKEFMSKHPNIIPGLHLEGPFISPAKRGIHPIEHIAKIDTRVVDTIFENADIIAYMTIDPVTVGEDLMRKFRTRGIRLSIGHTNCDYQDAKRFFACGGNMATHLFNAMSKSPNGRNPKAVEAILENGEIYTSVICDGIHVDYSMVNIAWRLLHKYFILTTDALASSGVKNPEEFTQFNFAGKLIYNDPILGCTDSVGTLAGSRLTMLQGLKNLINNCGLTLPEAIRAASIAPRKALNMEHNNVYMVLDADLNIRKIFINQKKN